MSYYSPYNSHHIYANYSNVRADPQYRTHQISNSGHYMHQTLNSDYMGKHIQKDDYLRKEVLGSDRLCPQLPRVLYPHYMPVNKKTCTTHAMPVQRPEQYNFMPVNTAPGKTNAPSLESVLQNQLQDFMTMNLERQVTEVSTNKENTKMLKNWLKLHRNNPYPSKTEKVMLAYSTRMTLTQVSNWFANARRRIKQEKNSKQSSGELSNTSFEDKIPQQEEISQLSSSYLGNVSLVSECSTRSETPAELVIDNSLCNISDLHRPAITPDSGLESFNASDISLEKHENRDEDKKGIKCKINLFGEDSTPEITVEPIEKQDKQTVETCYTNSVQTAKTAVKSSKIWSITDILN